MPSKPGGKKSPAVEQASSPSRKNTKAVGWNLPPLAWMLSSAQGGAWKLPERILICGVIPEIGPLAKGLRDCEFVVLESSESQARSLRTACSRRRLKNIRIEVGAADQAALPELIGGNFDLVLATGIFHSVGSVEDSMINLAACTARDTGGVYLELDAAHHPASRAAEITGHLPGGRDKEVADKLERIAAFACGVWPRASAGTQARPPSCWPFLKWLGIAASSGLRPAACTLPSRILPLTLPSDPMPILSGLDLVSLCCLLETMAAPPVLQTVFTRRPLLEPPWADTAALSEWCPCVFFWPRDKVPAMEPPFSKFMQLGINIPNLLDIPELQVTAFLLEFLRNSDGSTPVRQILEAIPHPATTEEIAQALFFFHHTNILRLLPPE